MNALFLLYCLFNTPDQIPIVIKHSFSTEIRSTVIKYKRSK